MASLTALATEGEQKLCVCKLVSDLTRAGTWNPDLDSPRIQAYLSTENQPLHISIHSTPCLP
jgi:hypothetical protein